MDSGPVMESLALIVLDFFFSLGNSEGICNWIRISVKINLKVTISHDEKEI